MNFLLYFLNSQTKTYLQSFKEQKDITKCSLNVITSNHRHLIDSKNKFNFKRKSFSNLLIYNKKQEKMNRENTKKTKQRKSRKCKDMKEILKNKNIKLNKSVLNLCRLSKACCNSHYNGNNNILFNNLNSYKRKQKSIEVNPLKIVRKWPFKYENQNIQINKIKKFLKNCSCNNNAAIDIEKKEIKKQIQTKRYNKTTSKKKIIDLGIKCRFNTNVNVNRKNSTELTSIVSNELTNVSSDVLLQKSFCTLHKNQRIKYLKLRTPTINIGLNLSQDSTFIFECSDIKVHEYRNNYLIYFDKNNNDYEHNFRSFKSSKHHFTNSFNIQTSIFDSLNSKEKSNFFKKALKSENSKTTEINNSTKNFNILIVPRQSRLELFNRDLKQRSYLEIVPNNSEFASRYIIGKNMNLLNFYASLYIFTKNLRSSRILFTKNNSEL